MSHFTRAGRPCHESLFSGETQRKSYRCVSVALWLFVPSMRSAYSGEMWYIAIVFFQPKALAEALQYKAELRERGTFIAGGTDLVVLMNHGKAAPEHLIDLSHIQSLTEIRPRNGLLELGGNVTFAQCA